MIFIMFAYQVPFSRSQICLLLLEPRFGTRNEVEPPEPCRLGPGVGPYFDDFQVSLKAVRTTTSIYLRERPDIFVNS